MNGGSIYPWSCSLELISLTCQLWTYGTLFFSHNKSANSTFQLFLAKRTVWGRVTDGWGSLDLQSRVWNMSIPLQLPTVKASQGRRPMSGGPHMMDGWTGVGHGCRATSNPPTWVVRRWRQRESARRIVGLRAWAPTESARGRLPLCSCLLSAVRSRCASDRLGVCSLREK
jgi:hypothetical protein